MFLHLYLWENPHQHTGMLGCTGLDGFSPSSAPQAELNWRGRRGAGLQLFCVGLSCFADVLVAMVLGNCWRGLLLSKPITMGPCQLKKGGKELNCWRERSVSIRRAKSTLWLLPDWIAVAPHTARTLGAHIYTETESPPSLPCFFP